MRAPRPALVRMPADGEPSLFKMVVADDDTLFLHGLIKHVKWTEMGVKIAGMASDGVQAVELCRLVAPDIALLDVRMPVINGIDVAATLRGELPDCQIILMSAYSEREYLRAALKLQVVDFVDKPVDRDELTDVVRKTVKMLRRHCGVPGEQERAKWRSVKVDRIARMVQEHYAEHISIEDLAHEVNLTPNYVSALFRQETGKTVNRFITEARMEKARELLDETFLSVEDIAHAVGYGDPRHFSRLFRKMTGCTPTEFRNRV